MIVRCWIKHRINNHPQGTTRGDIVEILPVDADPGRMVHRSHYPVDMDLSIPCGNDFTPPYKCATCVDNHPDTCDVRKYKVAEWDVGGVLEPPKVKKARKYNVDLEDLIPLSLKTIAYKEDKTDNEKKAVENYSLANPKDKTKIKDKTVVEIRLR